MKDNATKLTTEELSQAFEAYKDAEVLGIEEVACDVKKCRVKVYAPNPSRIEVILRDNHITKEFATYKLHVCTTFPKVENYKALAIQYFCRVEVDTDKVPLLNMLDCVNEVNQMFALKVLLRDMYDNGYLFCVEARCHVTNADDVVKWFDKKKWGLFEASIQLLANIKTNYKLKYIHALHNNLPKGKREYDNIRVINLD